MKIASASVVICAALGACATDTAEPAYSTSLPTATDEAVAARGSIISSSTDTDFDPREFPDGTVSVTFVYNSISGVTGESTEVTGALFAPGEPAPAAGHPVVAYAHGTVGIAPGCAPTESSELAGDTGAVSFLLQQGYAVVYPDYQGLSGSVESPPHPYLEPRTAGFNVIDSVRGALNLDENLSTQWVAVGTSQGGHAAWAAGEYEDVYGDGLELLGAAVLAPALDVSPVVAQAQTSTLSGGQQALYPMIVEGAAAVDPSIEPSDYLHGLLGERSAELSSCGRDAVAARSAVAGNIATGDTTATDIEAADRLTERLRDYALPKAPSSAPILAVYGGADDIVLPEWTEDALARACELGDTVLRVELEGQGHSVDPGPVLENWIADRFGGASAPNNC